MTNEIVDEYPSIKLEKCEEVESIESPKLGQKIKDTHTNIEVTLEETSQRTGLARSTLSKIENEQLSPTF